MSRGGKREGSGAPKGSRKYPELDPEIKTKAVRLPENLTEQGQAIVDVDLYLQKRGKDFPWLMTHLPRLFELFHDRSVESIRLSKPNEKVKPIYRRNMIPVAATLDLVPLSSDFDESTYEEVDLSQEFGDPDSTILLTVTGESMIEAGIHPGDELVVEVINYPMRKPNSGDLVIASIGGKVTVKEFRNVGNQSFLIPHNKELEKTEIIDTEDAVFHVYGIVKKLIRSFRRRRF